MNVLHLTRLCVLSFVHLKYNLKIAIIYSEKITYVSLRKLYAAFQLSRHILIMYLFYINRSTCNSMYSYVFVVVKNLYSISKVERIFLVFCMMVNYLF